MNYAKKPGAAIYFMVGVASAASLSYEILLLRVFSFTQWHHFASLAVALALLGFGAAGTLLALLGSRAIRMGDRLFIIGILGGAAGMAASFLVALNLTVRPLFAVWDAGELGRLLLIDFISFVPFFGLAISIGQVFMRWPAYTRRLYAASLAGSGFGSLGAAALAMFCFVETGIFLIMLFTLLCAAVFAALRNSLRIPLYISLGGSTVLAAWWIAGIPSLPVSDFKELSYLLDLPDSRIVERAPGLRATTTRISSPSIRMAPGLSLQWTESVPSNEVIVLDSDRVIPLPRKDAAPSTRDYQRASLNALPFSLRNKGNILILGTGNWMPDGLASESRITWIEDNPQITGAFVESGWQPRRIRNEIPRTFLTRGSSRFSIIFLSEASLGGDAATENYVLTVQSLVASLERLSADGLLAVPLPVTNPPRYAPRLMAMVTVALANLEVTHPENQVAFLRSMNEGLIIVGRNSFSPSDLQAIRAFSRDWGFDLCALPGLIRDETNEFHRLEEPLFFEAAQHILSGNPSVPEEIRWYSLNPAVDLRPYFWQSMVWKNVPALLNEHGRQGLVWLDWSLVITVVKLLAAGFLAVVLIILPLQRLPVAVPPISRSSVWLYFSSLGLGFLLLEMAFFQQCILYLGHPVLAASIVFTVFLCGSGLGSFNAPASASRHTLNRVMVPVLAAGVFAIVLLTGPRDWILSLSGLGRILTIGIILLPLSWALGRPMPWGLRQLDTNRAFIPWAWGINGFASVLAPPLATLLSVHTGRLTTLTAGLFCYLLAWSISARWTRHEP